MTGEADRAEPTPADVALIIDEHAAAHDCADTCAQARQPEQHRADRVAGDETMGAASAPDTCAQAREPEQHRADRVAGDETMGAASAPDTCAQAREPEQHRADRVAGDETMGTASAPDTCAQARSTAATEVEGCNRCQTPLPDADGYEILVNDRIVAPSTGHRLLCDPRVHAIIESADTGPLAVGRNTRIISRRMRRALNRRDNGCCQFPGCTATQRLHAHHIIHWLHGGHTELNNLILVCHFHHHLVHEGGWTINPTTHQFVRPDGDPIEPTPEHLRAGANTIEPLTWRGATGPLEPIDYGPFDLPWTTAILHHNEAVSRRAEQSDLPTKRTI